MEDRNAYIDKLAAQLKAWDAEIQNLEARADKVKADARIEYKQRIQELRTQRDEARDGVEKLRQSGEDAWRELKFGADKVFADMKATLDTVAAKFR